MNDARIRGGGGAEGGSEERLDEVQEPKGMDVGKSSKRGRSRERVVEEEEEEGEGEGGRDAAVQIQN